MGKRFIEPIPGRRVRLRLLERADLPLTLAWRNRPEIRRWFVHSAALTPDGHEAWFERYRDDDSDFVFVIEETERLHRPVGQVALYRIDWTRRTAEYGRLLIGEPEAAGHGLGQEATELLVAYAFDVLGMEELELYVFPDNAPALAIYRRCGFVQAGERDGLLRMTRARPARQPWDAGEAADEIVEYWQTSHYEAAHREILADLVARYLPGPGGCVLEVGCGPGLVYERLVRRGLDGRQFVGADTSHRLLAMARAQRSEIRLVRTDGVALAFRDGTFDLAFCFEVMGHVPRVAAALAELLRVTRGTCLFTVWPSAGADIVEGQERFGGVTFPRRRYSDAFIRSVLAAAGDPVWTVGELVVLGAECWCYVVRRTPTGVTGPAPRIVPAPGSERTRQALLRDGAAPLEARVERLQTDLVRADSDRVRAEAALTSREAEVVAARARIRLVENALTSQETELTALRAREQQMEDALASRDAELETLRARWDRVIAQAGALTPPPAPVIAPPRWWRLTDGARARVRPSPDLGAGLEAELRALGAAGRLATPERGSGFRLGTSVDLQGLPYVAYALAVAQPHLQGLVLAVVADLPALGGWLGIEIVTPEPVILVHQRLALDGRDGLTPMAFRFEPIAASRGGRFELRVFVREALAPVRILEWQRRRFPWWRGSERLALCGLLHREAPA